jgi:predicted amidohydrolase
MTRLGLVQMTVEGGQVEANLARAARLIGEASRRGAEIILLPEALDVGWTHPEAGLLASEIPEGAACAALRAAARDSGVTVCAGLTERADREVFNAAVLIDSSGRVLLHHRKLNELGIGHSYYGQGDRLGVAETTVGRVGVMICADAFARGQVIGRTLGLMGADLILSPCAWAVPADHDQARDPYGKLWKDNYGPVARDFALWIAGVSNVGLLQAGPWAGRKCIGNSMVVGPSGEVVLQAPYGVDQETILTLDIEIVPRPARGDGWESRWR